MASWNIANPYCIEKLFYQNELLIHLLESWQRTLIYIIFVKYQNRCDLKNKWLFAMKWKTNIHAIQDIYLYETFNALLKVDFTYTYLNNSHREVQSWCVMSLSYLFLEQLLWLLAC